MDGLSIKGKFMFSAKMKSFFVRFNVMWLGGLFFALLFLAGLTHSARFSPSDSLAWSTRYLDGIVVGIVNLFLLMVALTSYTYALWKSWRLTKSNEVINASRLAIFCYLFGVPAFLFFTAQYWLSVIRLFTDRLVQII